MIAWVGLGANLGDARGAMARACRRLDEGGTRVLAVSGLWRSRPMGPPDQPDYLNAAARIAAALGPGGLLARLREIERELGRRERPRWRERELDLDLLLAVEDGTVEASGALALPHPGLRERAFVLEPLLELDPDLAAPDGASLREDLEGLRRREPGAAWRVEEAGWYRSR